MWNTIYSSIRKDWATDTCQNLDDFKKNYAKSKKSNSKGYMLYDSNNIAFWKCSPSPSKKGLKDR